MNYKAVQNTIAYILRFYLHYFNIVSRELKWAGLRHETPGLKMSPNPALPLILEENFKCYLEAFASEPFN